MPNSAAACRFGRLAQRELMIAFGIGPDNGSCDETCRIWTSCPPRLERRSCPCWH